MFDDHVKLLDSPLMLAVDQRGGSILFGGAYGSARAPTLYIYIYIFYVYYIYYMYILYYIYYTYPNPYMYTLYINIFIKFY